MYRSLIKQLHQRNDCTAWLWYSLIFNLLHVSALERWVLGVWMQSGHLISAAVCAVMGANLWCLYTLCRWLVHPSYTPDDGSQWQVSNCSRSLADTPFSWDGKPGYHSCVSTNNHSVPSFLLITLPWLNTCSSCLRFPSANHNIWLFEETPNGCRRSYVWCVLLTLGYLCDTPLFVLPHGVTEETCANASLQATCK